MRRGGKALESQAFLSRALSRAAPKLTLDRSVRRLPATLSPVVEQVQVGFRVNCVALEEGRHAMWMRFEPEVFGNFQRLDDGKHSTRALVSGFPSAR